MVTTFAAHMTPYGCDRTIFVYLPDDWQTSGRRYPVLYMFDGHNLFFDSTATYGTCWGLKEYLDQRPDFIVVAPDCNHEGNGRLVEYCPYDSDWSDIHHGTGKATMEWMVGELKPTVDAAYPTLPDREHTAIGGSSMGGLMSLFAVSAYNSVFSKAACLSPSVRFCMEDMLADIAAAAPMRDTRVYVSWGENETTTKAGLARYTNNAMCVVRALLAAGAQVYPYFQPEGAHCEADWCKQNPLYFDFLFGEG